MDDGIPSSPRPFRTYLRLELSKQRLGQRLCDVTKLEVCNIASPRVFEQFAAMLALT
jgi:hypothetical protein